MVDLDNFYGVVATVDFALLGFWWVAVQERGDLRDRTTGTARMSYLVSLQFTLPGTAALLAEVAPNFTLVWRVSFSMCALTGVLAILVLVPALASTGLREISRFLLLGTLPLYLLIAFVAMVPEVLHPVLGKLSDLQIEAILFCLTVFLSAQTAWAAAMAPSYRAPRRPMEAPPYYPPSYPR